MRLIGKTDHYDRIIAYLKDPEGDASTALTEKEREMLARWQEAYTLKRRYNSTADTAAILMKRFPTISRATAYRDIASAVNLFGDLSKATKDGIRYLAMEIVNDSVAMARSAGDYVAMKDGAKKLVEVSGANQNDPDLPDFSKLQPHTYNITLPKPALDALMSMISKGRIDLGDMVADMAEDAEIIDEETGD